MKELYEERFTQLHELMRLCLQLNTETSYAVFIYDSGHVCEIKFQLCYSKKQFNDEMKELVLYYDKREYDNEDSLKEDLAEIKDFRNLIEELLMNPTKDVFKVTYEFGITRVSKTFYTEEDRQKWVDNAEKTVGKSVKGVTPIYETLKENRRL